MARVNSRLSTEARRKTLSTDGVGKQKNIPFNNINKTDDDANAKRPYRLKNSLPIDHHHNNNYNNNDSKYCNSSFSSNTYAFTFLQVARPIDRNIH